MRAATIDRRRAGGGRSRLDAAVAGATLWRHVFEARRRKRAGVHLGMDQPREDGGTFDQTRTGAIEVGVAVDDAHGRSRTAGSARHSVRAVSAASSRRVCSMPKPHGITTATVRLGGEEHVPLDDATRLRRRRRRDTTRRRRPPAPASSCRPSISGSSHSMHAVTARGRVRDRGGDVVELSRAAARPRRRPARAAERPRRRAERRRHTSSSIVRRERDDRRAGSRDAPRRARRPRTRRRRPRTAAGSRSRRARAPRAAARRSRTRRARARRAPRTLAIDLGARAARGDLRAGQRRQPAHVGRIIALVRDADELVAGHRGRRRSRSRSGSSETMRISGTKPIGGGRSILVPHVEEHRGTRTRTCRLSGERRAAGASDRRRRRCSADTAATSPSEIAELLAHGVVVRRGRRAATPPSGRSRMSHNSAGGIRERRQPGPDTERPRRRSTSASAARRSAALRPSLPL